MYPINVVEKETNISKYLLRMWERRYTFPRPQRDQKGERVYTQEDVDKLKLIKRLMQEGYRPSKIINQTLPELKELAQNFGASEGTLSEDCNVCVVITAESLEEEVKEALKNQNVRKVLVVHNHEDIKNLSL